jgi:putative PIN family toxin of toxin-antitoxin system
LRIFLDTNVLVSAFATRGLCAELFEAVLLEHELITGDAVLVELRRALRAKLKLPVTRCEEILGYLRETASTRVRSSSPVSARVDADDAAVLGEALGGHAEVFVTGDAAVLRLGKLDTMKIMSPRNFWTILRPQAKPAR